MNMPTSKLRIIPPPAEGTRAVLQWAADAGQFSGFIRGNGPTSYLCGLCGAKLVDGVVHGQLRNLVFRCPKCGSYNEIP